MLNIPDSQCIIIKGARSHNLKNIDVKIPRNSINVITGPSGSGKSSLAFDTLFAEGQRRYVESLSAYARQFLERMSPPDVDSVEGIPPAIAIEQKTGTRHYGSTVGTNTEIYDYLKLLYARIGKTISPISGLEVKQHTEKDVVNFVLSSDSSNIAFLLVPIDLSNGKNLHSQLEIFHSQGFGRILIDNVAHKFDSSSVFANVGKKTEIYLIIDRFIIDNTDPDLATQISESSSMAFSEGDGKLTVKIFNKNSELLSTTVFSDRFECDELIFEKPSVNLFSFNSPYGACRNCEGYGTVIGVDYDLVIPDKTLSVIEDAVVCWKGEKLSEWKYHFAKNAVNYDFPIQKPIKDLSEKEFNFLISGNEKVYGIRAFFDYVESQAFKIQYRVILSRYRGKTICPDCKGTRIRKDANYVKVGNKSILELVSIPIDELLEFFNNLQLSVWEEQVSARLLNEIKKRLKFMCDVGLQYLTLNRSSNTLSGGEYQRINLAQSVGSNLVGSLYVIDEPTVGLHPKDTQKLLKTLLHLKDLGNTVVIVEHDEEIIKAADFVIDMGPLAGIKGGVLNFCGTFPELLKEEKSLTAQYFTETFKIEIPYSRRKWKNSIDIIGAAENNLQYVDVKFPLNILTVISGPSGSGKSTLLKKILVPLLSQRFGGSIQKPGKYHSISGDFSVINGFEFIDQNPVGRSSRSNPVTYTKAFDDIRTLFSNLDLSKKRGYKPGFFSFNVKGGRCEKCSGDGYLIVEMQFLANVELICEACKGLRYTEDTLEVKYKNKSISDVLKMSIEEAYDFFETDITKKDSTLINSILEKIKPLIEVGLGYLEMGQPTSTLSGGEIQRLKLASFLIKGNYDKPLLFIFDEPTTGLHYWDIHKLYVSFEKLLKKGHSIIVIEHNMEIIKCADWIIELGPDGGKNGGRVIFQGLPEDLINVSESSTAEFLKEKLNKK